MSQNTIQEEPINEALQPNQTEEDLRNLAVQDSLKVEDAILELLNPDSKIKVETNASGTVVSIMNGETEVTGEEFKTYKKAYERIHRFSRESNKAKNAEEEALIKMAEEDNRKIDEALKARDIANANKVREYNRQIDEELERRKNQKKAEEVNRDRIRSETRKVEREIPEVQVAIRKLKEEMKASGMNDSTALKQYENKLEELSLHLSSLNAYSTELNKYQREVNKYLKEHE